VPRAAALRASLRAADVVAVQTEQDAAGFIGWMQGADQLRVGRPPAVRVLPVSVDVAALRRTAADPWVREEAARLRAAASGRTVILGLDRLDYTKGIPVRLDALASLVRRGDVRPDEVLYRQVATPSRIGVKGYAEARTDVDDALRRLRAAAPGVDAPVEVEHRALRRQEVVAAYLAADVLLVTPLRDGMNLVAKEFVAVRENSGAMVLSRTAGAAAELTAAWQVDATDVDDVAAGLLAALRSDDVERGRRMRRMAGVVARHDVHAWARGCLGSLDLVGPSVALRESEAVS
jgi:trehalose-6-phosphate synthase